MAWNLFSHVFFVLNTKFSILPFLGFRFFFNINSTKLENSVCLVDDEYCFELENFSIRIESLRIVVKNRMGNNGSSSASRRRHHRSHQGQPSPQPEITANRYVFAAATPYPNPNPPPQYYQYPGYYPQPPPIVGAYPPPYHVGGGVYPAPGNWPNGPHHYGAGAVPHHPVTPFVEHQKAVTIRNDVNIKKESLRLEPDEENPGQFLVAFTFDATAPGR